MNLDHYLDAVLELWAEKRARTETVIKGNSMAPLIRHGDTVVIKHGDVPLRVGDVVVAKRQGSFVAHRLVHSEMEDGRERFLTRGDACGGIDPPVRCEQIIGKVVEVRNSEGRVRLDSRWWHGVNLLIARLYYLSERGYPNENRFGWGTHFLFAIRRCALPAGISATDLLARAHSRMQRSVSRIQKIRWGRYRSEDQ
jgi:hypothetical protein